MSKKDEFGFREPKEPPYLLIGAVIILAICLLGFFCSCKQYVTASTTVEIIEKYHTPLEGANDYAIPVYSFALRTSGGQIILHPVDKVTYYVYQTHDKVTFICRNGAECWIKRK